MQVSDPSRTVVDILDDPKLGGGMRNVAEVVTAYFESEHCREGLLLEYAERLGNRVVFKRLGYLTETLNLGTESLVSSCLVHKSKGLSQLDPSIKHTGRITKRWGLCVNVEIDLPGAGG